MKKIRGSALDIFGFTRERRTERQLIKEYELMMRDIVRNLNSENYQNVLELARLPDGIRGFGHVKMASVNLYQQQRTLLLKELQLTRRVSKVA